MSYSLQRIPARHVAFISDQVSRDLDWNVSAKDILAVKYY